ncbi:hypothetical protein Tsubulata_007147 [Turnera subulata]|uniref:Uncharacterized protein n=1 Tax=Turnera subulata TaxID=218843 RepID=A0A9Q0F4L7_9ROSI|nr:hypothetical protein Tsubulata_007147 [Turnera subulata]
MQNPSVFVLSSSNTRSFTLINSLPDSKTIPQISSPLLSSNLLKLTFFVVISVGFGGPYREAGSVDGGHVSPTVGNGDRDQQKGEDQPDTSNPAASFQELVVERWRKLRKTEDRVRALQERLRKLVENQEGASSATSTQKVPQPTTDKTPK